MASGTRSRRNGQPTPITVQEAEAEAAFNTLIPHLTKRYETLTFSEFSKIECAHSNYSDFNNIFTLTRIGDDKKMMVATLKSYLCHKMTPITRSARRGGVGRKITKRTKPRKHRKTKRTKK
jgi:hypothetical protein